MKAFAKKQQQQPQQQKPTGHLQTQSLFSPHPMKLGLLNVCLLYPQCEDNLSACPF